MFLSSTLLSFLVLALSTTTVNATPIQQRNQNSALGLVAKINASGSKTLADIDRARVAGLIAQVQGGKSSTHQRRADGTVVATDDGVTYTANVGVGTPPTDCELFHSFSLPRFSDTLDRHAPDRHRQLEHLGRSQQSIRQNQQFARYW